MKLEIDGRTPGSGGTGTVFVTDKTAADAINVSTSGAGAIGILAQSLTRGGSALLFDTTPPPASYQAPVGLGNTTATGGFTIDLNNRVSTTGAYAPAILAQSLDNAHTLFGSSGQSMLGGTTSNLATNLVHLRQGSQIATSGASSHGLWVQTASSVAAVAQNLAGTSGPNAGATYGATRAASVIANGNIAVSGANAWAIRLENNTGGIAAPSGAANLATTHLVMGPTAQITLGANSGGGILIKDGGNAVIDLFGSINPNAIANGATMPPALSVNASNITLNTGEYATINGGTYLTLTGSQGRANLNLQGNLTGGLFTKSNGGYIDIKSQNAVLAGATQKKDYDVFFRVNATALEIDTTNASIGLDSARGIIKGAAITPGSGAAAYLEADSSIFGTIDGAFNFTPGPSFGGHFFAVDGSGGPSDYINIVKYDSTQITTIQSNFGVSLFVLPTPGWKPYDIIRVTDKLANSAPIDQQFAFTPVGLGTTMNLTYGTRADAVAVVTLQSIAIDFTKAGLTGNDAQVALLANAQVNAIASGATTPDTSSTLYASLLRAANEGDLPDLQTDLSHFNTALQYSQGEANINAATNAANHMQSCGGETRASVNPLAQGACLWARFTHARGRRDGGRHRDNVGGLALGRQFALSDTFYVGLAANFERTEFTGPGTRSEGDRFGVGAIAKYSDGNSFASVSTLASFGQADALRRFTLAVSPGQVQVARSEHETFVLTTRLRGGHRFKIGSFDVIPTMEADIPLVRDSGYSETGAGQFNLQVAPETNVLVDLHPSVEIGADFPLGTANVRAVGQFGHRFALNDITSRTRLANGFDSDFATELVHRRDRSLWTYGVGLILDVSDRLEARLSYDLADGDEDRNESFAVKVAYKF